ncbi:MAG: lysoplasmalogenase [Bacilli bacterium]|nr:lysoplasmalogenase [Bacilli bacterium]
MSVGVITFIVIYCAVLCCYFYTETTGDLKLRAPNKILMALMFFIFGTVFICKNFLPLDRLHYLAIAGLFLAMLGDIFLLFSYNRGGDFFLAGNVCFVAYQVVLLLDNAPNGVASFWWVFLIIPVLWTTFFILFKKFPNFFKLNKMRGPFLFYLSTIISNGVFGLAVAIYVPKFLLFGLGMFIFMLSDFDITFHKFVCPDNKWVLRLNSALYFVGMLIAVLTFAL